MNEGTITSNGSPTPPVTDAKNKIRIVVADDHPIFRDGLCRLLALEEDFVIVAQAHDGREVLQVLQEHEPDILLLDLKMPKVDGLEVLRQMKADPALKRIPVVMMTSSREHSDLMQSYELGVNSYVVKPVKFQEFIDAVKNLGVYWVLVNEPPPPGGSEPTNRQSSERSF